MKAQVVKLYDVCTEEEIRLETFCTDPYSGSNTESNYLYQLERCATFNTLEDAEAYIVEKLSKDEKIEFIIQTRYVTVDYRDRNVTIYEAEDEDE